MSFHWQFATVEQSLLKPGVGINDTSVETYETGDPSGGDTVTVTNSSSGATTVTYAFSGSDDNSDVLTRSAVLGGARPAFIAWKGNASLVHGSAVDVSVSSGIVTESGTWYFKCEVGQTGTNAITLTQTCTRIHSETATVAFAVTEP